jgi:CheY-like chemotaxis protein
MGNLKLLLLEAEPVIAAHILNLLEGTGCDTFHACDTREALDWCAQHRPQLALLNFHADGLALAFKLRDQFAIKSCFVSGSRQKDIPAGSLYEGNFTWLQKPFTPVQFKKALAEFLP